MAKWIESFMTYLEAERNASPHTRINYQVDLKEFDELIQQLYWSCARQNVVFSGFYFFCDFMNAGMKNQIM